MTDYEARQILELGTSNSLEILKKQYRKKVLQYHPDRNIHGDNTKFLLVQKAYELILANLTYSANPQQTNNIQNSQRKEAEAAYKARVKYYYQKRKKTKEEINAELKEDFTQNIKYFVLTILLFICFFLFLIISLAFGAVGVISFLIILSILHFRYDFSKLKI